MCTFKVFYQIRVITFNLKNGFITKRRKKVLSHVLHIQLCMFWNIGLINYDNIGYEDLLELL